MKTALAYILNAYLIALLVGAVYLSHSTNFDRLDLPRFEKKEYPPLPDFGAFKDTKEKKRVFFEYFGRIVDDENDRILAQRDLVLAIQNKKNDGETITERLQKIVLDLATTYGLKEANDAALDEQLNFLLTRIDIVPRSLALAQAAKESAWGTSRFAREGNNFFGQWCYDKGCGMVPLNRNKGAYHEVKSFSSPAKSVRSYLFNINTHFAYEDLRAIREQKRSAGSTISGLELSAGLQRYSERGQPYVTEIRNFIRSNKLNDERDEADEQLGTR